MFVEVVSQVTGLMTFESEDVGRGRKALVCRMTKAYWDFMRNWQRNLLLFRPVYMPMVVPPGDWTAHDDGGFVTLGPLAQLCHGKNGQMNRHTIAYWAA